MKILVTEPDGFSPKAVDIMKDAGIHVDLYQGEIGNLHAVAADYDGAIIRFATEWRRAALEKVAHWKVLASPVTGVDHVDVSAAADLGIDVVTLADLQGLDQVTSTAELALGLLLCLVRNISQAHNSVMAGSWNRDLFVGRELKGRTVGIVGMGRLGRIFSGMAEACRMSLIYYDPHVDDVSYKKCESLDELAAEADVVSLHVKLNLDTEEMIGKSFFEASKPGQLLINTARGGLVDEDALLQALRNGQLAGAGLDVLADEPETGSKIDSPLLDYARTHFNVVLTPHIGGATFDAMRTTEEMLARELARRFGSHQS